MPLSYVILFAWITTTAGTLWGLFELASGGMQIQDASMAATIFMLLGTLVGATGTAAQQVIGYWFGSSKGSADKTAAMVKE